MEVVAVKLQRWVGFLPCIFDFYYFRETPPDPTLEISTGHDMSAYPLSTTTLTAASFVLSKPVLGSEHLEFVSCLINPRVDKPHSPRCCVRVYGWMFWCRCLLLRTNPVLYG